MASRSILARSRISLFRAEPCASCHMRQVRYESSTPRPYRAGATIKPRVRSADYVDPVLSDQRKQLDMNTRYQTFSSMRGDGMLAMTPKAADKIIIEFHARAAEDPASVVQQIAANYKLQVSDLTNLAHGLWRIPDPNRGGRLPESPHHMLAGKLFVACMKAKDPNAILHIANAVYLSPVHLNARAIANLFTSIEIKECRQELAVLASNQNPDAMILQGQFFEREGSRQKARALYEGALGIEPPKYEAEQQLLPGLPLVASWNALGFLLLAEGNAKSLQDAKEAFRKGALEGDDPLSYYHLALLEENHGSDWLRYMTKAAGTGHVEAMHSVAAFYLEANPKSNAEFSSTLSNDKPLEKALRWLFTMKADKADKAGRPELLGWEWFRAAAARGHKPSMLKLADNSEAKSDLAETQKWLEAMAEPPYRSKPEDWPGLVKQAKERLKVMKSHSLTTIA